MPEDVRAYPLSGRPWISALIFFLIGLALVIGGLWLVALGGSFY